MQTGNWTKGRIGQQVGPNCAQQVDKAVQFHDPLKGLKLKTLASDGVIKKDNDKIIPLHIYYVVT